MNSYVTGCMIKELREKKGYTQSILANKINVSEKTISKWESGRGLPDISLLEPLSKALDISLIEFFCGKEVINQNKSANLLKTKFYVCPLCGNVLTAIGEGTFSCCGYRLIPQEEEDTEFQIEMVDNEILVKLDYPMTKEDYISFIAYVTTDRIQFCKMYPEQECFARFHRCGRGKILFYNNRNGLFAKKI